MAFDKLFEPLSIGPVKLKNRLAISPMNMVFSDNGYVNDQILAYYAARAKGGASLIITEATIGGRLAARYRANYTNLLLYDSTHLRGQTEIVETIHAFGAKAFIQLYVGPGRTGKPPGGEPPIAPSAIPYFRDPDTWPKPYKQVWTRFPDWQKRAMGLIPREVTLEEIRQLQEEFVEAAVMATLCGFDGIEIHLAHGYLPHQFLSPRSNKRTDLYGGSLENRMRFSVELVSKTIQRVRKDIPDFPIGVRMSTQEHQPDGFSLKDAQVVLTELVKQGITFYDVSTASHENYIAMFPNRDGTMLPDAAVMRKTLGIPVITPAIHDPENALKAVEDGLTDIVSLGRASLADPEWPNKVRDDKTEQIRKCNRDYFCLMHVVLGLPVRCSANPDLGRERYMDEYRRPSGEKGEKTLPRVLRKNKWD